MLLRLAFAVALLLSSNRASHGQAVPATATTSVKLPAELLGSWTIISHEPEKANEPQRTRGKIVFASRRCYMGRMTLEYAAIDMEQKPHAIDFKLDNGMNKIIPAIFEVQGDALKFCLNVVGGSRPKEFKGSYEEGCILEVCRRAPDASKEPLKTAAEVDASLLASLSEMIKPAEANDVAGFIQRSMPPAMKAAMSPEKLRELVSNAPPDRIAEMRATLSVLLRLKPTFNQQKTEATYDLSLWHIPGGTGQPTIKFTAIDGKWYGLQ